MKTIKKQLTAIALILIFFQPAIDVHGSTHSLTVLFAKGKIVLNEGSDSPISEIKATGQQLHFDENTSIALADKSYLFAKFQDRCFHLNTPGRYSLMTVLNNQNSFLCKVNLFLSRISEPVEILLENHPRGASDGGFQDKQELFRNTWINVSGLTDSLSRVETGKVIAAASFYESENDYTRVALLLEILSRSHSVFRDFYSEAKQRTTRAAMEEVLSLAEQHRQFEFPNPVNIALLIGINEYQTSHWQDLDNAVADISRLKQILIEQYGFDAGNIRTLENAGRDDILFNLEQLAKESDDNSNVLIYYAGHGYYNDEERKGYWIPSDGGELSSKSNYIESETIISKVEKIPSAHTLLMADSCFSGDLIKKARTTIIPSSQYFLSLSKKPSRQIISAGGVEAVSDRGADNNHSVFAESLFSILSAPRTPPLSASELALLLRKKVKSVGNDQTPAYGRFAGNLDKNGEYFFVRKDLSLSHIGPQRSIAIDQKIIPKVIVTDIKSNDLTSNKLTALSSILRTSLSETNLLEIVDLSKKNEKPLNENVSCNGSLCVINLARKVGADAIISVTLHRLEDETHFLTANVLNVYDGTIIVTKTIKHEGSISGLNETVRKLAFKLYDANGTLVIKSFPSDATIILDNKLQENRSNTTLTDITPGIHTLILQKDQYWTKHAFELQPGENKELEFNLFALPIPWKIESEPSGAKIFIDGNYEGITPLSTMRKIGTYSLKAILNDYMLASEEIPLNPTITHHTRLSLKKKVAVTFTISPPDTVLTIDDTKIAAASDTADFYTIGSSIDYSEGLSEGKHKLVATHPGMKKPVEMILNLEQGVEYAFDVFVELEEEYLNDLHTKAYTENYDSTQELKMSALGIGGFLLGCSLAQYPSIKLFEEKKDKYESLMLNAASEKEALVYYKKAKEYSEQIDEYNNRMILSAVLSLGSFAFYYWLEPEVPERQSSVSLEPLFTINADFGLNLSYKW
ncbi:caspase family protein [bacterium]|nr:caspase family protein [bacterium]